MFASPNYGWMIHDDCYYSPDEIATILKCEMRTVLRWCKETPKRPNYLRHFRLGKVVRIRGLWLKDFFDGRRPGGDDPSSRN